MANGVIGLSVAAAAVACALALPAAGQEAAIARCNALPTDPERVACLTDALRRTGVEVDVPADPAAPVAAPAAPTPTASAPVAPAALAAEPESRRRFGLPFFGDRDEEPSGASARMQEEDFGAEQVSAARGENRAPADVMTAAVVSSEVVPYKRLQVELDNGQVWRQVDAEDSWDPVRYDAPTTVEITPRRFGDYRMRLDGGDGPTTIVERVR